MELVLEKKRLKIIPKAVGPFSETDVLENVYIEKALGLTAEGDRVSLVRKSSPFNGAIFLRTETDTKLNAAEALFGFCGWLTSRKKAVTLSSTHNAGVAVELIEEFCKVNGLDMESVRKNWTDYLTHPTEAANPTPKEPPRDYDKEEEDRLLKLLKKHNKKSGGDPNIIEQSEVDAMLNSLDAETTKKEEKSASCKCSGKGKPEPSPSIQEVVAFILESDTRDRCTLKKNWEAARKKERCHAH